MPFTPCITRDRRRHRLSSRLLRRRRFCAVDRRCRRRRRRRRRRAAPPPQILQPPPFPYCPRTRRVSCVLSLSVITSLLNYNIISAFVLYEIIARHMCMSYTRVSHIIGVGERGMAWFTLGTKPLTSLNFLSDVNVYEMNTKRSDQTVMKKKKIL